MRSVPSIRLKHDLAQIRRKQNLSATSNARVCSVCGKSLKGRRPQTDTCSKTCRNKKSRTKQRRPKELRARRRIERAVLGHLGELEAALVFNKKEELSESEPDAYRSALEEVAREFLGARSHDQRALDREVNRLDRLCYPRAPNIGRRDIIWLRHSNYGHLLRQMMTLRRSSLLDFSERINSPNITS